MDTMESLIIAISVYPTELYNKVRVIYDALYDAIWFVSNLSHEFVSWTQTFPTLQS